MQDNQLHPSNQHNYNGDTVRTNERSVQDNEDKNHLKSSDEQVSQVKDVHLKGDQKQIFTQQNASHTVIGPNNMMAPISRQGQQFIPNQTYPMLLNTAVRSYLNQPVSTNQINEQSKQNIYQQNNQATNLTMIGAPNVQRGLQTIRNDGQNPISNNFIIQKPLIPQPIQLIQNQADQQEMHGIPNYGQFDRQRIMQDQNQCFNGIDHQTWQQSALVDQVTKHPLQQGTRIQNQNNFALHPQNFIQQPKQKEFVVIERIKNYAFGANYWDLFDKLQSTNCVKLSKSIESQRSEKERSNRQGEDEKGFTNASTVVNTNNLSETNQNLREQIRSNNQPTTNNGPFKIDHDSQSLLAQKRQNAVSVSRLESQFNQNSRNKNSNTSKSEYSDEPAPIKVSESSRQVNPIQQGYISATHPENKGLLPINGDDMMSSNSDYEKIRAGDKNQKMGQKVEEGQSDDFRSETVTDQREKDSMDASGQEFQMQNAQNDRIETNGDRLLSSENETFQDHIKDEHIAEKFQKEAKPHKQVPIETMGIKNELNFRLEKDYCQPSRNEQVPTICYSGHGNNQQRCVIEDEQDESKSRSAVSKEHREKYEELAKNLQFDINNNDWLKITGDKKYSFIYMRTCFRYILQFYRQQFAKFTIHHRPLIKPELTFEKILKENFNEVFGEEFSDALKNHPEVEARFLGKMTVFLNQHRYNKAEKDNWLEGALKYTNFFLVRAPLYSYNKEKEQNFIEDPDFGFLVRWFTKDQHAQNFMIQHLLLKFQQKTTENDTNQEKFMKDHLKDLADRSSNQLVNEIGLPAFFEVGLSERPGRN